ncbi:MAG: endonuclease III [Bdellovibrionales bacterium]|nr:endonuclease III [Bdellovibrionales bacterium]
MKSQKSKVRKNESVAKKKERLARIIKLFQKYYPDVKCALNYTTPEELLVATILSAQCTDARVNIVTETLFKECPVPEGLARASIAKIEKLIHSTGFYKNKAKNLKSCCLDLVEKYGGKVPRDLNKLTELGGVGRKTANVVLGNAFGIASGVVVDTHVTRLSNRLGLVQGRNAVQLERELNELVEKKHWINFSHWLITHGRSTCGARSPKCEVCFLEDLCPKVL